MSRRSNNEQGNGNGKQRRSPTVVAAALRKLDLERSDAIGIVDLTQLIEQAVEACRQHALACGVRLACCYLDDLGVLGSEREISTRLDMMLAGAIDAAIPGTHMECNTAIERGGVVVRLRFLRPAAASAGGELEIIGGEIVARWPLVEEC